MGGATRLEYNQFLVCGLVFECPNNYIPVKPVGKGAYGLVCSAQNLTTREKVAIKKISSAFSNVIDARRTLREIKLLRHVQHENVIQIKDIIPPTCRDNFKDVYLVYDLMDTDLHQIIRSTQQLSDDHCQYFLYQLLRGLKYIHSANILHRDLKPSNLLLNANCDLKICDFGLARTHNSRDEAFMTEYVVTRWYRAPELLLSCNEYTAAIDVWSVGCIFAELLGRKPLFPGKDYVHQLNLITSVIGTPSEEDTRFISSEKAKRYIRSLPPCAPVDLRPLYPKSPPQALDLLQQMLRFSPEQRITVQDALAHPYMASLHDINDEPVCPTPFHFEVDTDTLMEAQLRTMVLEEIHKLHPGLPQDYEVHVNVVPTPPSQPAPPVCPSAALVA